MNKIFDLIIYGTTAVAYVFLCFAAPFVYEDFIKNSFLKIEFEIRSGMSAYDAACAMKEAGIIKDTKRMVDAMANLKIDRTLQPGLYEISPGSEAFAARELKRASGKKQIFTLIPGTRYKALAKSFMKNDKDVLYEALLKDESFYGEIRGLLPASPFDRIAFLLPETYFLSPSDDAAGQFIEAASRLWYKRVGSNLAANISKKDLLRAAALASIVEGEAKIESERPILSGIFMSRLKKNMRLESCATVIYCWDAVGVEKHRLSYNDLKIDSPYNTYTNSGLPPGPISVPSESSWHGALAPLSTDYLFFFATSDGSHVFSKTYEEHIKKQKNLKK